MSTLILEITYLHACTRGGMYASPVRAASFAVSLRRIGDVRSPGPTKPCEVEVDGPVPSDEVEVPVGAAPAVAMATMRSNAPPSTPEKMKQ